jgi:hypothetical protein
MTKRVTVSLPDDVADRLAALPDRQVSPYVAEAIRRRQAGEDMRDILRAAGHPEYPYDPDGAAERLAAHGVPEDVVRRARERARAQGLYR